MRRHRLLAVLAVVVAGTLLLSACGDDDDDTNAGPTTRRTQADNNDNAADDLDDDAGAGSLFSSDDCRQLAEAIAKAGAAMGNDPSSFGELGDYFDEIADRVPDEIEDDFRVFADAYTKFAQELEDAGVDFDDPSTMTPDAIQDFAQAAQVFDDPEVKAASERLSEYSTSECTTG